MRKLIKILIWLFDYNRIEIGDVIEIINHNNKELVGQRFKVYNKFKIIDENRFTYTVNNGQDIYLKETQIIRYV